MKFSIGSVVCCALLAIACGTESDPARTKAPDEETRDASFAPAPAAASEDPAGAPSAVTGPGGSDAGRSGGATGAGTSQAGSSDGGVPTTPPVCEAAYQAYCGNCNCSACTNLPFECPDDPSTAAGCVCFGAGVDYACPPQQPLAGYPCQLTPANRIGLSVADCSYGDDPRPQCRTLSKCTDGAWVLADPTDPVCENDPLPAACPESRPSPGDVCDDTAAECWYPAIDGAEAAPSSHCICSACVGGSGFPVCQQLDPPEWACTDTPADCPDTIPQAGQSCDVEGASCGPDCDLVVSCVDSTWSWSSGTCPRCASPETRIATPDGERAIATLELGDLVYSVDHGAVLAVPLLRVASTPVAHHHVMRVVLETGRTLEISPGHPTADGRRFDELRPGSLLDEQLAVREAELVDYRFDRTYDILPASDTGTYFAEGALIGSTLNDPPICAQPSQSRMN